MTLLGKLRSRAIPPLLALAALVVFATPGRAQDAVAPGRHACSVIAADAQRLACYDQTFGHPDQAASQAAPAAAASVAVPVPAVAPVTVAAPAQGADPVKDFGLTEAQKREIDPANAAEPGPSSISAQVVTVETGRNGGFVVTLDNGQVWAQSDTATRVSLRSGDLVTIRRAAMGSHMLVSPDRRAVRARRIK